VDSIANNNKKNQLFVLSVLTAQVVLILPMLLLALASQLHVLNVMQVITVLMLVSQHQSIVVLAGSHRLALRPVSDVMLVIFAIQLPHRKLKWKPIHAVAFNVLPMLLQAGKILVLLVIIVMVINSNPFHVQSEPTKPQELKQQKRLLVLMFLQATIMMNKVKIMHKFK